MSGRDFSTPSVPFQFRKNAGGLNSTSSPTTLEDDEASDLQNIDFDIVGSFRKRMGYTQLNTSAFNSGATWNGLYWFEKSDGTKYLMGVCGNKLGVATSLTQAATPFTDRTGGITLTAGNNNQISWACMLDTVLGTNGVDAPFQCVGSGNAAAMAVPTNLTTAKFVEVFANYTFLANVNVNGTYFGSRVYWSAIDSISSWSSSDFRDVSKADGQVITGLKTLGDTLVIFKRRSIWIASFTGDSDIPFVFQKSRSSVGCVSGYSIQEVENGLVFLSDDGFYYFDGNNSFKTSQRIRATLDTFNLNRFANAPSIYYYTKNRYISSFTLSGNSTHDRNITWDSFNNAFSLYKGINANCYARVYNSGQEQIFFGDYSGFVYQMDTGNTDNPSGSATAIDSYWYSKWFDFQDLVDKKIVPQVAIYYEFTDADLTFAYSFNFEQADQYSQSFSLSAGASVFGTAIFDTDTFAGSGGAVSKRHLTGRGEVMRIGFKNSTVGETFSIDGFGAFAAAETNVK